MNVRIDRKVYLTTGQQLVVSTDGVITAVREPNTHVYKASSERFMGVPQRDRVKYALVSK